MLKWARQNGCSWNESTCSHAAIGGHLAVLQWARHNGCRWSAGTCTSAALTGHLAVLQWARQKGCHWNKDTCAFAAAGGQLAVLKWLYENDCPWSGFTTFNAAYNNRLDTLKWARQQQPPCPWWSLDELDDQDDYMLSGAKPSTLLWLAQQGAPLPEAAHAVACSTADRLTNAYIALRALLPAELLLYILTLSME